MSKTSSILILIPSLSANGPSHQYWAKVTNVKMRMRVTMMGMMKVAMIMRMLMAMTMKMSKIPSEMEVALLYTPFTLFSLLTLSKLFLLFKLLYTA